MEERSMPNIIRWGSRTKRPGGAYTMTADQSIKRWPVQDAKARFSEFRPTLKELLLAETPRAEIPVPSRRRWRRRPPEAFDAPIEDEPTEE
jgi:hypothetical protein